MGRICDSWCRWGMGVILRHPVAVLRAEFWAVCIFLKLVSERFGLHTGAP